MDPLYAFFVQWSPSIYGGDDEIDPAERGFVVIDEEEESEEEEEEEGNVSLNGKDTRRLKRQMTKDWEVRGLAHHDVMTWKYCPHFWLFKFGIYQWLVDSPHKGPVM